MFDLLNDVVQELQGTNSRLQKEAILRKYADNDHVKRFLFFLFNPYIITGISKKKVEKYKNTSQRLSLTAAENMSGKLIEYLMSHGTGRDEDLLVVESYAQANPQYSDLIYKIASKSLTLGVTAVTINKIYGSTFIPQFSVMLAEKFYDNPEKYLPQGTEFILTTKLDGVRCICVYDKGNVTFFSRQGQVIEGLSDIEFEVRKYLPDGFVYDGELLLNSDKNLASKDLYRATVKVTSADGPKTNVIFNIFDLLPVDDFTLGGVCYTPAKNRKAQLHNHLGPLDSITKWIREVPVLYLGKDQSMIARYLDTITKRGGEGVMINTSHGAYECKRSRALLKVKKMNFCDIRCIDIEEGSGNFSGTLGAIICKFIAPADNKEYTVRVGSGFTLDERNLYWNNPDLIIDKIVEVQYFEITTNEQNTYSLRFPVFCHIRNDKTEISMF